MREIYERKPAQEGYSPIENAVDFELKMQSRKDFERQYPIGAYFADFYFPENNLVLEIDGADYHSTDDQQKHDRIRDKYMNDKGFCVLRVTGAVAKNNPSGILTILKYLSRPKTYFINTEDDLKNIWSVLSEVVV